MFKSYLTGFLVVALVAAGCQVAEESARQDEVTGIYYLVRVDGSPVPAAVDHDGTMLDVHSGTLIVSDDGTCFSRTRFTPHGGEETTREAYANYEVKNSRLFMKWQGAGTTEGTVQGDTFVMDNHGMIFEYAK